MLLDTGITITKPIDLIKLDNKLKQLDIRTYVQNERPSSKWKPHLVTYIVLFVAESKFPLGKGMLPNFATKNNNIIALNKQASNRSRYYNDNLCAFRCLAYHRKSTNLELSTKSLYGKRRQYNTDSKLPTNPKQFSGLDLNDIPVFEDCFQLQVTITELQETGTVICRYHSIQNYQDEMHLNLYEQHLSYINNFPAYAKKIQCLSCDRLFNRMSHLKRHTMLCCKVTKYKLPGGMFK